MAATRSSRNNEDRLRLIAQINEWNSNRLDLFALSQPNEDLEFFGVMRFFYQDDGEKVSTKCVRVSSTASTKDVMGILIEKFRPDLRMLSRANYALYEVHVNGEERQLKDTERPLLVQLNWGKDDREGRLLLKRETDKTMLVDCTSTAANESLGDGDQSFKRKLSKREKKELKKKEKEQKIKGKENDSGVAEKLYNELPESSFTRSISNPELVMRKRRQLKLEKKLQQIRSNDGGPDNGGTLKIYGSAVNPDVPYKTLLLAVTDTVAHVVKETLEKYGMEKQDPDKFCLIQVMIPPDGPDFGKEPRERVLEDDECPLSILLQHPPSKGTIMFQLRPRTADMPKKIKKKLMEGFRDEKQQLQQQQQQQQLPSLLQISSDGADPYNPKKYYLAANSTEIGRERNGMNPNIPHIQLATQDILPVHCVVTNAQGVVTVTPMSKEALIFVNGTRVSDTTVLRHGMVVQFGKLHQFRFLDAPGSEQRTRPVMPMEPIQAGRGVRDFETNFDVDGRVETIRMQSAAIDRGALQQQQPMLAPDPRFGPPGYEADLLPASLSVPEEAEDKFLSAIINDDNLTNIQFRMAPTYVVYMLVRSRVLHLSRPDLSRPDLSPNKQSWLISSITSKVAHMVHQRIRDSRMNPGLLSFWMANASEMLNFFKRDADVLPSCLSSQNLLAEAVQLAFNFLVDYMQAELGHMMPAFLNPKPDEADQDVDPVRYPQMASSVSSVLQVLSSAMTVLRRCRVNAALTIQLFSQLFHFINMWLFNRLVLEPQLHLCTRVWGQLLRRRLGQIEAWAEKQGLELAAECHLAKVLQAAFLLESPKTLSDIGTILANCENLNSIQMRRILTNYLPGPGEPPLRADLVEQLILGAQNTVDEMLRNDGLELRIDEPVSLQLPFLLPDDGYSCEFVKGVPGGLAEFLVPFIQSGICRYTVNQNSRGTWMIYMTNLEDCHTYQNLKSGPAQQSDGTQSDGRSDGSNKGSVEGALRMEPDIFTISFSKVKNSLGLSIVAAKGESQKEKCIYVKSVVPGGGAAMDGRILAGDQLLEVDGKSLVGLSQEKAAEMMTQTGQVVTLKIAKQGAIFHGLATLLNQTQQPPVVSWTKQSQVQLPVAGGAGGRMHSKADSTSQPSLAVTRPLSNDFRNSPKPLNQQLEAKSTPALTDARYHEHQMMGEVDMYSSNCRSSPQQPQAKVTPNARLDPLRHNSSSQPDLINRQPERSSREDVAQLTVPSAFPGSQLQDYSRYGGQYMKGARSSPNISTEAQKGFQRMPEDAEHQRILEWQQRNQMLADRDQLEQSRSSGMVQDDVRSSVGTKEFPGLMRPDLSSGGRTASLDDERGRKLEPADTNRQTVKPVLPYQPQQPATKKGPGYATQMLFPAQAKSQPHRDGTAGYQTSEQSSSYAPGKQVGQPSVPQPAYGSVGSSLPSDQGDGFPSQPQSFPPGQPQNYPGSVLPHQGRAGPYVAAPFASSAAQYSEYRPISEFSHGYSHASTPPVGEVTRMRNPASVDPDFPPPPSDLHLAQMGAKTPVGGGDVMSTRPGGPPSFYSQQTPTSIASFGVEKADMNPTSNEPGKFFPGERQPASMHSYQGYSSAYPQRLEDTTRSTQGLGNNIYQSSQRLDSSSSIAQPPVGGPRASAQPPAKKPPPIAAKPKVVSMAASGTKPFASSPWDEKEAKEKQMDEDIRRKRQEEIKRLQNRPYRSPEEQNKLQRLLTEEEFDRRAQEASEDKDSDDASENQADTMRRMEEEFQKHRPMEKNQQQPEPMYAKVDKQHLLSDMNRLQGEFQQRGFQHPSTTSAGGGLDRKPEQQRLPEPMKSQGPNYPRPGPGAPGWSYEMTNQDPGRMRYPPDDRKQADSGDYLSSQPGGEYPRQMAVGGGYSSNQEMEKMVRPSAYQMQTQYGGQPEYSGVYQPPTKPGSDVFNTSIQPSQSSFGQQPLQPTRSSTASALKQPDSQTGAVKKSVTFCENIGVTEYTINRSYGSTSSEGSFPQSPEQNLAMRLPSDQPPVPPPATYLTAAGVRPSMPQQYAPTSQPSYGQHQRNVEPSYQYGAGGGQDVRPPAIPYKIPDQGPYQETDHYTSDPRYSGPSSGVGGGFPPQQQYSNSAVQSLYSYQQDPRVYSRQPQQQQGMRGPENASTEQVPPNNAYMPGSGAGVTGAQEVYRDPRDRIMASKAAAGPAGIVPKTGQRSTPDRMTIMDKMSMFASEAGE